MAKNSFFSYKVRYYVLLIVMIGCFGSLRSQNTLKSLEGEKISLLKEIEENNKHLQIIKNKKSNVLNDIQVINEQIKSRNKLIKVLNLELELIKKDIDSLNISVSELRADVERVKSEYEKLILYSYKRKGSLSELGFILGEVSFNES